MDRRRFLEGLSAAAISGAAGACASPQPAVHAGRAADRRRIAAVCFDLFTLFDPRSVVARAKEIVPDAPAFCEEWRARQFQYAFVRAAGQSYADFEQVTRDSLAVVARARKVELSAADRERLAGAYSELAPWPDTRDTLGRLRQRGLKLAPLSNYSPRMVGALLAGAKLEALFDAQISTDAARTYKPDPRAYALGPSVLGVSKAEIAFSAFGGWDAAGARWFGFPTFWVNRLGVPGEELGPGPDASGPSLAELESFILEWA